MDIVVYWLDLQHITFSLIHTNILISQCKIGKYPRPHFFVWCAHIGKDEKYFKHWSAFFLWKQHNLNLTVV